LTHDFGAVSKLAVVRQCSLGGADDIKVGIDKDVGWSWRPEWFPWLAHDDGLLGKLRRDTMRVVQFEDGKLTKSVLKL
jgi:hypothetical protein